MRFLHFTDLHYCPEKDGRSSRELREALPEYIKQHHLKADEIFFTGDYRHAVLQKDETIEEAATKSADFIKKIANASGISDMKHVHLIPGNHDKSRNDKRRLNKIKKNYSVESGNFSEEDYKFLISQFEFFFTLCKKIYGDDYDESKTSIHTYTAIKGTVILRLNTAIMHNSSTDRNNLIIGNEYLALILEEISRIYPKYPIIILAHHAIEMLNKNEREAVEQIFHRYPIMLYLCGDSHEVWWRNINGYLEITMGCLKSDNGVQTTFLYGNTLTDTYTAYRWDYKFGVDTGWGEYTQFNDSIQKYGVNKQAKKFYSKRLIQKNQVALQNDVLLPWMKRSTSYLSVFPELFIEPKLYGEKIKGRISFSKLISEYRFKNIVLSGDAGFGKSTLLKYLYLFNNIDHEFLYLKASSLQCDSLTTSTYEKYVINLLLGKTKTKKHKIILIDGVDEAFVDANDELNDLFTEISNQTSNISVWFGWRTENYYQQETEKIRYFIDNVISVQKWNTTMIKSYVRTYSRKTKQPALYNRFINIASKSDTIWKFAETPFQLTLLLYLLENENLSSEVKQYFDTTDSTIYELYRQFFICWLQKERHRNTSLLPDKQIKNALQSIAQKIYYGESCVITSNDSAITDLLTFSGVHGEKTATGFYHRSFCAFFFADSVFESLKIGGVSLIQSLKQPLRNDITDFIRSALGTVNSRKEIDNLQKNLMETYLQIIYPYEDYLDSDAKKLLNELHEEEIFSLKNELIYFITRMPHPTTEVKDFVALAYENEKNPYMKLDLAYGAVLTGPSWIALEYAKSLEPGKEADFVNRSWTIAYFGDVQANPYYYQDVEGRPWTKSREARLKRFQSQKRKAVRFRILDFPLMYCFYASRGWKDVNEKDYKIIEQTSINNTEYNDDEKLFLKEQKEKLILEYRKHLEE